MIPNRAGLPAMALPFPRGWVPLPSRTLHVVAPRPALPKGAGRASLAPVTPWGPVWTGGWLFPRNIPVRCGGRLSLGGGDPFGIMRVGMVSFDAVPWKA